MCNPNAILNQNVFASKSVSQGNQTDGISGDWQTVLADAVRDPAELRRLVGVGPDTDIDEQPAADTPFGVLVPRTFLARMRAGDHRDPLLLQVMPQPAENLRREGFSTDPLCESAGATPCLLQKYKGRSLILTTAACGVHCRYCFRRHLPHQDGSVKRPLLERPLLKRLGVAIHRIETDPSIHEVILSGGDPLTIADEQFAQLVAKLAEIKHLRRLRVHTRLPIVIPQRITEELVAVLKSTRLVTTVVVQSNHPAELCEQVAAALGSLIDAGVPVLCQSVLLAGVNDKLEVLAGLCERLIDCRVMPYYLHQLDRVAGAAHFEVSHRRGLELIAELRELLPGYAVPRYVREVPGATHKKVLG